MNYSILLSASSISNLLPVACFITVSAFILILFVKVLNQGEDIIRQNNPMSSINATVQIPQIMMKKLHIPFIFRLEIADTSSSPSSSTSSQNAVKLIVSSNVKYSLQAFFNVEIRALHMQLWRSWNEIRESIYTRNEFVIDQAHFKELAVDLRNQLPHGEREIVIKSPNQLNLGTAPRSKYPLVVFLIRVDDDADEECPPDETALLMNVIHLRDSQCPLPTSVLAQYLKQASGTLSCLKQLYLSAADNENEYSIPKSSLSLAEPLIACTNDHALPFVCSDSILQQDTSDQLCVVCRFYPLSRALLPCRHTVLCAICFEKLDRCPICRAPITAFFRIRSEDYVTASSTVLDQEPKQKTSVNWIDALNDRLTDFLGFR